MSKLILHIGTHKTATTTIQNVLWGNRTILGKNGIEYPKLGYNTKFDITGHHGIIFDWLTLPPVYKLPMDSRRTLTALANDYGDSDVTVVLSSEEFSRFGPNKVDFAEFRDCVSAFDRIEVICFLRTQWQLLQSTYLELSKKSVVQRTPQIAAGAKKNGHVSGVYMDFNLLLDHLLLNFSEDEITLVDMAAAKGSDGGIMGEMLRLIGAGLNVDQLEFGDERAANVSPMPLASWMANIASEPKVAPNWLIDDAAHVLKSRHGEDVTTCLLSRGEVHDLNSHFMPLNRALAERRAPYQPGFSVTENDGSSVDVFREDVRALEWTAMTRRVTAPRL